MFPGWCRFGLAHRLECGDMSTRTLSADEFLEIERIPVRDAILMAEDGRLPDAKSLAALFVARKWLNDYP